MTFIVKFDTDNAAFENDPSIEAARILRMIADRIETQGCPEFYQTIHDINGNDVGRYALKHPERI